MDMPPKDGSEVAAAMPRALGQADEAPVRLDSRELFRRFREVEIAHGGRVYTLRLTGQNKLILTA